MRAVVNDVKGAIYVEFLLVFLPVFLLFLAVLELGFVYAGRMVVQHAATRAARATVVTLDDDPALYGNAPRGRVDPDGATTSPSAVEAFLAGAGYGQGAAQPRGGPRFRDIRSAASITLLALAPSQAQVDDPESIAGALGSVGQRPGFAAQRYNEAALAITFPTEPTGNEVRTTFGKDDLVTVRVTYLLHCGIPLVPNLMCDSTGDLGGKLTGAEQAQLDLGYLAGLTNPRFQILRAETTLRNQGAGYLFPSEQP